METVEKRFRDKLQELVVYLHPRQSRLSYLECHYDEEDEIYYAYSYSPTARQSNPIYEKDRRIPLLTKEEKEKYNIDVDKICDEYAVFQS
jgi:hypothetical protein